MTSENLNNTNPNTIYSSSSNNNNSNMPQIRKRKQLQVKNTKIIDPLACPERPVVITCTIFARETIEGNRSTHLFYKKSTKQTIKNQSTILILFHRISTR